MTDKAKKRRRELAAKLTVSRRTAANIVRSRASSNRSARNERKPDFFGAIAAAISGAYTNATLNFVDEDKRLEVRIGAYEFAFLTPRNAEPAWPVFAWNETARAAAGDESTRGLRRIDRKRNGGWECETIEDVLTVLRWPAALPSGPYASANEIRDRYENPSQHVWLRARHDHPEPEPLMMTFQCKSCGSKLYVRFGETVEDVARMGYENWREREAGTFAKKAPRTLTRSMGVGFIPPICAAGAGRSVEMTSAMGQKE